MADDWQVGDLALCVNVDPIFAAHGVGVAGERFLKGRIYQVAATGLHPRARTVVLWLAEDASGSSAGASRFRKIRPHAPDAEDEETIRLLNGVPVDA